MKRYFGAKIINAKPMSRQQYNDFRGWQLPADECGDDAGYLVEYADSKPNTKDFAGYISWSPAEPFNAAYREITGASFGLAVEAMKLGRHVSRTGWNGKGMFLRLVKASEYEIASGCFDTKEFNPCNPYQQPFIAMKTAQNMIVPWVASQSDLLSDDWHIIE